jgi:CubicO group peptidase (beta-lactamase class C family)
MIDGRTAPGFERVREAFAANFAEGLEVGSAFAAYRDGEMLVDLWGGEADRERGLPWREDSLQLIFSGSKGLTAICILMLIDRGLVELDAPVARYWPGFGKPEILVRNILSHTARLPGIEEPLTWGDLLDDAGMARRLERQPPFADPRAEMTYHPITYGWLCGELLRQVDGRSLGRFFADEVAKPLGLEIWFGLPEAEELRVTTLLSGPGWATTKDNKLPTPEEVGADPLQTAIWYNPPLFGPSFTVWNSRALHAVEMPGANAIATARSVARLYSIIASGGGRLMRPDTVRRGTQTLAEAIDRLNGERCRYGAGFSLQTETNPYGPHPDGFGHGGAGGSLHGGWPSRGIGFSYAMNQLVDGVDIRAARLLDALAQAAG